MHRIKGNRGFAPISLILVIAILIVLGIMFAVYYRTHQTNNKLTVTTPKTTGSPTNPLPSNDCQSSTVPGEVIFYYNQNTPQDRLNDIISSVNGTVSHTYAALHGYAITVPKGTETSAVTTLKSYPEVTTVDVSHTACLQ